MQQPETNEELPNPQELLTLGTTEYYRRYYSDKSKKQAHFGYLVDVMERDFMTRTEFIHTVATGSPEYEQLLALGHECTYSNGADPRAGLLQNSIDTQEEFIQLCRIIDPALECVDGG